MASHPNFATFSISYDSEKDSWTILNGDVSYDGANTGRIVIGSVGYVLAGGDAHSTLTEALATASDGDIIMVAPGTYEETLTITKDVTIRSLDGEVATTVIEGGIHIQADGVTISGLTIEGGSSFFGAGPAGILVQANGVTLQNNALYGSATSINDAARGILVAVETGEDLIISNNTVIGWATGAYLNPGASGIVEGNTFKSNDVGVSMDAPVGISVTDNTFDGNFIEQIGAGVPGNTLDLSEIVADNTFKNTPEGEQQVFIYGDADSETIVGTVAADKIIGGGGIDTVIYGEDSMIEFVDGVWTVTTADGIVDTLTGVERVTIGDHTYILVDDDGEGFTSIQDAVNATNAGDTILVADGTYAGTVVVNKAVTIQGIEGEAENTIVTGGIHINADGVTIDGLHISGAGTILGEKAGVYVSAANVTIVNSILTGPESATNERGVLAGGSADGLTISNNTMEGWATGVYLNPGATGTVEGNTFTENNVGVSMDDPEGLTVTGNTFENNKTEQVGVGASGAELDLSQIVADNEFIGSTDQVVVWGANGDQTIIGSEAADVIKGSGGIDTVIYGEGATIEFVDGVWTVTTADGIVDTLTGVERVTIGDQTYILVDDDGEGFTSIQDAVNAAHDGDTILVADGTYEETLIVNKAVTITSLEGEVSNTVVEGGIHIQADGVTINGLTIEGGTSFFGAGPAGILVQANGVTLQNNVLYGAGDSIATSARGVLVAVETGNDLTLSNNHMEGWATGAYLNPGATGTVTGNTFAQNDVGLSMDDPSDLSVTGNTFDGNFLEQIGAGVPGNTLDLSEIVAGNRFEHTPAGKQQVFIYGDADSETIVGTVAADKIIGGGGIDTVIYGEGATIEFVDDVWTITTADGIVDTLTGVERVTIGSQTYILVDDDGVALDSIQDAVDLASDGDIIMVAAGSYSEMVTVDKDVTILGVNAGVAGYGRVTSGGSNPETYIDGGIHILKDGVTLDGLAIMGGDMGGEAAGVFIQAANATISNSILMGQSSGGPARGIVTDASAEGLVISDNAIAGWATGAYLNPGATGTVTGNVLIGNNVGISIDDPDGLSVSGNVLFGNAFENIGLGIYAGTADASTIIGANTILSNAPGGDVSIYGLGSGHTIQGTAYADTFHGSDEADIFVGGAGNDVINGGDGEDTAVFSGNRSDYSVSVGQNDKVTITDLRQNGGTGTDILSGVESFQFANGKISYDTLLNNETPTAVYLSGDQNVAENAANGTIIGTLSADDENEDDSFVYELVDNAGGRFAISDGKLVVANGTLLDYEKGDSHEVKVKVTDLSGASFVQSLSIYVDDVNEGPTPVRLLQQVVTAAENGAAKKVADIDVTDDALGINELSLVGADAAAFEIRGTELWFRGNANFEAKSSYAVAVKATDKNGAGSDISETFTLKITDVNEAPTDIAVSGGSVLENSAVGTLVASLSGVDQDAGETFTFALLDNAGGRFAISGDKILVADSFKLDYEQATSHQVVVRVTDKNGATYDEAVTLSVGDVRVENISGSSGSDKVVGGSGNDKMSGGSGNDILDGGAGKDVLNGGSGNDRLIGGAGQDTLTGGSGKDVFVFGPKSTGSSKKTADYITDFSGRGGDKIDLSAIDANVSKKGNQAFSFIGTGDFTKAGQVRYEKDGKDTYVYLNTDNDKAAEAVIRLKGAMDLQKSWFVL